MDVIQYQPGKTTEKTSRPASSSGSRRITTCIPCRSTKRRCNRDRPTCSLCLHLGIKCRYLAPGTEDAALRRSQQHSLIKQVAESPPPTRTANSLSSTAWKSQLQEIFWDLYLPKDDSKSILGTMFGVTTQFTVIQQTAMCPGYLKSAAQACVLTTLGYLQEDSQLLQQGMFSYGQCLGQLNGDLKAGRNERLEEAMNTCQLLCLYEMMKPEMSKGICTARVDAWRNHATATCEIYDMIAKQRSSFRSFLDTDDRVFRLTFRNNFSARSPRCLSIYDLKQKTEASTDSVTRNTLHFIMAKIPTLFMRGDTLLQELAGSPPANRILELEAESIRILNAYFDLGLELRGWASKILDLHNQEADHDCQQDINEEHNLRSISQQHGIGFLLTINEYWTCRMVINFQVQRLLQLMQSKTGMDGPVLPDWMKDVRPFVRSVAESAHILLAPEAGLWVSEQAFFCIASAIHMTAAMQILGGEESMALAKSISPDKNGQIGFIRDFLVSIASDSTSPEAQGDMEDPDQHYQMAIQWFGR